MSCERAVLSWMRAVATQEHHRYEPTQSKRKTNKPPQSKTRRGPKGGPKEESVGDRMDSGPLAESTQWSEKGSVLV